METSVFLDEFRPFRRGELALAKRTADEPKFLPARERDQVRYVVRLAQLSSLNDEPDALVDRLSTFRLRLLQLLAPVLPTDPARIDPAALAARLPRVMGLAAKAREQVLRAGCVPLGRLDEELANKRLAVVLGGAAGSGYVFLGALKRLAELGLIPAYLTGCSVGAVLGVIRGRRTEFDLDELFDDVRLMRERGVFQRPDMRPRFGLPAALGLDLRRALGELFEDPDGQQRVLGDLAIPVDVLATGVGSGALSEDRDAYAHLVDADVHSAATLARIPAGPLARLVGALVSLAMSRQVMVPVFLGADPRTRQLPALDAAGFSASIPGLLHYDLPEDAKQSVAILEELCEQRGIVGLVDGALASLVPARYAWEAIESGRIGSRNVAILALDAVAKPRGTNLLLAPILRVISATADRDKAFWDLHVNFRHAPPFLDLFPSPNRLRLAARQGRKEFEETAQVLRALLAPLPPWSQLYGEA